MVDARSSACYMAGVIQAAYDNGNISHSAVKQINELLEDDNLEHIKIE